MTDELHNLLGKYFAGQATADEEQRIREWSEASEENMADFRLLEKLWDESDEEEQIVFDTEKAWNKVDAKIKEEKVPVRSITRRTIIAIAATTILALGMWWLMSSSNKTVVADVAMKEILLEDGSRVYLRKGSTLQFPQHFEKGNRTVELEGEAFFEITPNKEKPFIVHAAQATVEVVGTSFNVNTGDNKVDLVVKTGRVKFGSTNDKDPELVVAGEKASLKDNVVTKAANTDVNFNAWQTGELIFNNTPLPDVVGVLSDYYNIIINFNTQDAVQISATEVTARFNNQSLDAVLNEISLITSYQIRKTGENLYEISIK